jgi:hypothetical protein
MFTSKRCVNVYLFAAAKQQPELHLLASVALCLFLHGFFFFLSYCTFFPHGPLFLSFLLYLHVWYHYFRCFRIALTPGSLSTGLSDEYSEACCILCFIVSKLLTKIKETSKRIRIIAGKSSVWFSGGFADPLFPPFHSLACTVLSSFSLQARMHASRQPLHRILINSRYKEQNIIHGCISTQ